MRECPRCERCYEDEVLLCPDDQAKTKHTLPGTTLLNTRYRLEKRLGRGAMGQVYVARDENLITRRVAVKTIRPDVLSDEDLQEGEAIARFEREARTAASVQHPNVIGVTDFGKSEEGVFFLVMEYVEGESLYQLLRREGTIPVQRALALLRQTCAGVEAAHDEGILHRDLKPANIFIVQKKKKDGSTLAGDDIVKVGDFGLAKIISQSLAGITSGSGPASRGILGTPEYMAPEQMHAGAVLDARADVYA
ncbi:MAG TPA: serine/threonine-protein kinase, partial [Pyrinomonadaceae bacterium]|nr:serine/threonine-protein kinase [Pyrinomonadaceae bacterium]